MEELIPKVIEFGALAVINVLLIFKGVKAMQDLTANISKLTDKVESMSKHIDFIETRLNNLDADLRDMKYVLENLARRLAGKEELK